MAETNSRHMYTVSKLTRKIKSLLEENFPFIWITGEVSNHATPASGHSYFTLKDTDAVINAVMFKNQKRKLNFSLENGISVFGLARLTLYEPRGSYQLIFEHIEPVGTGSLQLAFEQLKTKLKNKGFFDDVHKKPIPFLSEKVCVITSGTGAAVRDILSVASRRFPNCHIEIIPVKVQGDGSVREICNAFHVAQEKSKPDVIILARGGGSLEDMQSFNNEQVADAIFNCTTPVITGIGHETDFTIADFVADFRAPTPSAAAEIVFPDKAELLDKIEYLSSRLGTLMTKKLVFLRESVTLLTSRLKTPDTIIYHHRLQIEDYQQRLSHSFNHRMTFQRKKCEWMIQNILSHHPKRLIKNCRSQLLIARNLLDQYFNHYLIGMENKLSNANSRLKALSPHDILGRGYSITRTLPGRKVVSDTSSIETDELLEIILSKGRLTAKVEEKHG